MLPLKLQFLLKVANILLMFAYMQLTTIFHYVSQFAVSTVHVSHFPVSLAILMLCVYYLSVYLAIPTVHIFHFAGFGI